MPNGEEHIRVKNAIVQKSSVSVEAIKGKSLAKTPEYIMGIPEVLLRLLEITVDHADVVIDFEHIGAIIVKPT